MSSNIKINRICEYCGNEFIAQTTVTKYCNLTCNRRGYKQIKRQGKIQVSQQQMTKIRQKPMDELKSKEFLLVKDAAVLLSSSRQMIYNLINAGKLPAKNIQRKKTLISRIAIDKLMSQEPVIPLITKKNLNRPSLMIFTI